MVAGGEANSTHEAIKSPVWASSILTEPSARRRGGPEADRESGHAQHTAPGRRHVGRPARRRQTSQAAA